MSGGLPDGGQFAKVTDPSADDEPRWTENVLAADDDDTATAIAAIAAAPLLATRIVTGGTTATAATCVRFAVATNSRTMTFRRLITARSAAAFARARSRKAFAGSMNPFGRAVHSTPSYPHRFITAAARS